MKRAPVNLVVVVAAAAVCIVTVGMADEATVGPPAIIRGEATYQEQVTLLSGARLEVRLLDISLADAAATVIAETIIENAGRPPYVFTLAYEPAQINERHLYAVRAVLTHEDQLLFTTDQVYPVITNGAPNEVNLMLRLVRPPSLAGRTGSDRDEFGCIRSAGYVWCGRENACVRPWELARKKGFEPGEDAFRQYCTSDDQK
jgi:putative lipoprotein